MAPTTFAEVLPITPLSSHTYSLTLEDAWCIGAVPNGGYTTSAFLICARIHMQTTQPKRNQPHPINVHIEFLRRTAVGPGTFTVREMKLGSRVSNLQLALYQNGNTTLPIVEGYVTMSNIANESGFSLDTSYRLHPPPLPADLPTLLSKDEDRHYTLRRFEPFPKFRRAALNVQLYLVKPSSRPADQPRSIGDQWIRFFPLQNPNGRWTNDALGFLVDLFPQIIEQYINPIAEDAAITETSMENLRRITRENEPEARFWYPTLALNLDIKKLLPENGVELLFVRVQAKVVRNGRFDLEISVWDIDGEMVALSTHASMIMDTSRNLTRSGGDGKKGASKL
jgi:Thioesterase-like superfamily